MKAHLSIFLFIFGIQLSSCDICPYGYSYNNAFDRCYRIYTIPQAYQQAEQQCVSSGGYLVSIHSPSENAYVNSFFHNQSGTTALWIGLNSLSGYWTWSDTSPVNYTNWASGQPTALKDSCTTSTSTTQTWYSSTCYSSHAFMCSANVVPTTVIPTTTPPPPCDSKYPHYNQLTGGCYYIGTTSSFWGAESFCNAIGGHLASVQNAFENSFLVSLTQLGDTSSNENQMTWIGGHYADGEWFWTDNTNVTYTNWLIGSPIREGKLSCAYLIQDALSNDQDSIGFWKNTKCDEVLRKFICKKPSLY